MAKSEDKRPGLNDILEKLKSKKTSIIHDGFLFQHLNLAEKLPTAGDEKTYINLREKFLGFCQNEKFSESLKIMDSCIEFARRFNQPKL